MCVCVCGRSLFHTLLQHEGGAARTSTCVWSVWVPPPADPPHPLGLALCEQPATPQQQQQLSPSSCCFPEGVRATPPPTPHTGDPHPPHWCLDARQGGLCALQGHTEAPLLNSARRGGRGVKTRVGSVKDTATAFGEGGGEGGRQKTRKIRGAK